MNYFLIISVVTVFNILFLMFYNGISDKLPAKWKNIFLITSIAVPGMSVISTIVILLFIFINILKVVIENWKDK